MLYRLYLYKTSARRKGASCNYYVSNAIKTGKADDWKKAGRFIVGFDLEPVQKEIRDRLGSRCSVIEKRPGNQLQEAEDKRYLYIATSYEMAKEVISVLQDVVFRYDLVLYDREREKSFFKEFIEDDFIQLNLRSSALRQTIMADMKPVRSIRMIWDKRYLGKENRFYVVTINKDANKSFEERTRSFYQALQSVLAEGETLICEDGYFTIDSEEYKIGFCLEGYKKHADRIGYYHDGIPCSRLLHRMGIEEAFLRMGDDEDTKRIFERMDFLVMILRFRNPADRFVASVKITRWEKKWDYNLGFGSGMSGSYIYFYPVTDDDYKDRRDPIDSSIFSVDEEWATYILPFVEDVYPYFDERYYGADNHMPPQMWRKIVERINYSKDRILNDIHDPEYRVYIDKFNLYMLVYGFENQQEEDEIRKGPAGFLERNKGKVLDLYKAFLMWLEAQLRIYEHDPEGCLIGLRGP